MHINAITYLSCIYGRRDYECDIYNTIFIYQYFLSRRIIAYALLKNSYSVQKSINELRSGPRDNLGEAILAANSTDPKTLCQAAYYALNQKKNHYSRFGNDLTYLIFTPGAIYENVYHTLVYNYFAYLDPIDPLKAGCDITIFSPHPIPTPLPTATPEPTRTPSPTLTPKEELAQQEIAPYFRDGDYKTALAIAENSNLRHGAYPPHSPSELQYWRALSLEALGRLQEAATAYDVVRQSAPETVWARLAQLHLG
jgi:hypothetical protein